MLSSSPYPFCWKPYSTTRHILCRYCSRRHSPRKYIVSPHSLCLSATSVLLAKKENITQGLKANNDTVCNISKHPKVSNRPTYAWESYFLNLTAELIIPFDQLVQVGNTIGKYSESCVRYTSSNIIGFNR